MSYYHLITIYSIRALLLASSKHDGISLNITLFHNVSYQNAVILIVNYMFVSLANFEINES